MEDLLIAIIKTAISLFEDAKKGDKESLDRLINFLPENLRTELVAKIQDYLDEQKFGRRNGG